MTRYAYAGTEPKSTYKIATKYNGDESLAWYFEGYGGEDSGFGTLIPNADGSSIFQARTYYMEPTPNTKDSLVKYDSLCNKVSAIYNTYGWDTLLHIDSSENLYVGGDGYDTEGEYTGSLRKYNSSLELLWALELTPEGEYLSVINVKTDSTGLVYAIFETYVDEVYLTDLAIISSNGELIMSFAVPFSTWGIFVDRNDDFIVAYERYPGEFSFTHIKWDHLLLNPVYAIDDGIGANGFGTGFIGCDYNYNVYTLNAASDSPTFTYKSLYKYDSYGVLVWEVDYSLGIEYENSLAYWLSVFSDENTPDGHIYVAGVAQEVDSVPRTFLRKYASDGSLIKAFASLPDPEVYMRGYSVFLDQEENIYLTHDAMQDMTNDRDCVTNVWQLNIDGTVYARRGAASKVDGKYEALKIYAIATDPENNVYACSDIFGEGVGSEVFALDEDGVLLWEYEISAWNGPLSIALDIDMNIYVAFVSTWLESIETYASVAKLSPAGELIWSHDFYPYDLDSGIVIDDLGHIYVTGIEYGEGVAYTYVALLDTDGVVAWIEKYEDREGRKYKAFAIEPGGNAYLATIEAFDYYGSDTIDIIKIDTDGEEIFSKLWAEVSSVNGIAIDAQLNAIVAITLFPLGYPISFLAKQDSNGDLLLTTEAVNYFCTGCGTGEDGGMYMILGASSAPVE